MSFEEILDQAIAMLQRRGRGTYRALKRQFNLDDAFLEDLTLELIKGQRLARDEDGAVLVWTGDAAAPAVPVPTPPPATTPAPLVYTPPYLQPTSCCWSTTALSISTAGVARRITRHYGSTHCLRRVPLKSCKHSWATIPAWRRSHRC
jgi:hypothetical protein